MALPDAYDRIVVFCNCSTGSVNTLLIYNGDHASISDAIATMSYTQMMDESNADRNTLIEAVEDGDCDVYLRDVYTIWAYEDLPPALQRLNAAHPFHPNSGWQAQHIYTQHGDVEEDSTSGKPEVTLKGDIRTRRRVPDSDSHDVALDEWAISVTGATSFFLDLEIDATENVAPDDLDEYPQVIAMSEFLRDNTTGGSTITASIGDTSSTAYQSRDYNVEQESGSTVRFRITTAPATAVAGGAVILLTFGCTVQSGTPQDLDEDAFATLLATTTVSVDVDDTPVEHSQMGSAETHLRGSRLYLASEEEFLTTDSENRLVFVHNDGTRIPLESGYGRAQELSALSVPTGETYRQLPKFRNFDTLYLDDGATQDYDLQLITPRDFIGRKGLHRRFVVLNRDDEYDIVMRDWDDDVFLRLYPGERVEFQMTQQANGAGELITLGQPPTRHLDFSNDYMTGTALSAQPRLDITSPDDGSVRTLPVPSAVDDYEFLHEDYFTRGTGTFTDALAIQSETTESNVLKAGAWKVIGETDGFISITSFLTTMISTTATGIIEGVQMVLFRFRDNAITAVARVDHPDINSLASLRANHRLTYRGRMKKDDIYIPGLYYDDGHTLMASEVAIFLNQFEIEVQPQIKLDYSP